jgi:hypothetical protein
MQRRTFPVVFLLLLWQPVSGKASAQTIPPAPEEGPGTFNVSLRGGKPKLRLAVLPEHAPEDDSQADQPIKVCEGDCSLALPPGGYRLEVSSPADNDVRGGTAYFTVCGDSEVTVQPASQKDRKEGLAGGIVGSAVAGVALGVMAAGLFISMAAECLENCQDTEAKRKEFRVKLVGISGGVMLAGGALAAYGFTNFARNQRPTLKVAPAQGKSTALRNLRLGPVRMGTGWGLGGAITF